MPAWVAALAATDPGTEGVDRTAVAAACAAMGATLAARSLELAGADSGPYRAGRAAELQTLAERALTLLQALEEDEDRKRSRAVEIAVEIPETALAALRLQHATEGAPADDEARRSDASARALFERSLRIGAERARARIDELEDEDERLRARESLAVVTERGEALLALRRAGDDPAAPGSKAR